MFTQTDKALLSALRRDARQSITDLAAKLGVSHATAKARLEHLKETGAIRRFTIETDTAGTSLVRAISLIQLQGKMSRAVIRALGKLPQITTIHSTNGTWDLVADIRADSLGEFDQVLRQIREIPGVLNSESCLLLATVSG